jgi:hypothetical protein
MNMEWLFVLETLRESWLELRARNVFRNSGGDAVLLIMFMSRPDLF